MKIILTDDLLEYLGKIFESKDLHEKYGMSFERFVDDYLRVSEKRLECL